MRAAKITFLIITIVLSVPFFWIAIQTFKPVRNVTIEDVIPITGMVTAVDTAPGYDIAISLENDAHYYYINRGLQTPLNLDQLRSDILNKTITLYSVKRWTLFTRDKIMGHISKLMVGDRVLFNELQDDKH